MSPATINPFRAPTSSETSSLEATHVSCDVCDACEPWPAGARPDRWACGFCGEASSPVFEHHSSTPLGYRDDKKCQWQGYELNGRLMADVWVYRAAVPA